MLPQIFFLIGIFSLMGCGENASEQSVRKWNEQEKQRAAEIEAGRIDTTAARAEMTYCQTNRDQILTSAKSLLAENRISDSFENLQKCFYWLNNDADFSATVKKALSKSSQIELSKIPKDNYEERLFILRGILSFDPSLKSNYKSELDRLEGIEKSTLARENRAIAVAKKREGVRIGMTPEDVLASQWGKPNRINRTTTAFGIREQWVYNGGYLYFDNGKLDAIQN